MNKKTVKEILKSIGCTLIAPSWFTDNGRILFTAFDNNTGNCAEYYIDPETRYATRQNLSSQMTHNAHDCSTLFFK